MPKLNGLGQIAYHVTDVAATAAFFRDKLNLPFLFSAGPGMSFFDLWGVRLMVSEGEAGKTGTLYFSVDDIDEAFKSDLEFVDEPHLIAKMPDHDLWMVFFKDPDGNLIGFMEERKTGSA